MSRWEPDSRGRLQEAALALYSERGFDQTTAAEIAARAGVTERTFFRHFADKREVLFGGSEILQERIVSGVAGAPAGDTALEAVARGLDAAAVMLGEGRRDLTAQRQTVIAANPDLQERELAKLATYAAAVAATLRQRGVSELQATLAAEAGMSVLRVAIRQWANGDGGRSLPVVMKDSMAELRAVTAGGTDPMGQDDSVPTFRGQADFSQRADELTAGFGGDE
jgi:AcrR family transcriptional regulator